MRLALGEEEAEGARHLLEPPFVELKREIHDTDIVGFRRGLARTRASLEATRTCFHR